MDASCWLSWNSVSENEPTAGLFLREQGRLQEDGVMQTSAHPVHTMYKPQQRGSSPGPSLVSATEEASDGDAGRVQATPRSPAPSCEHSSSLALPFVHETLRTRAGKELAQSHRTEKSYNRGPWHPDHDLPHLAVLIHHSASQLVLTRLGRHGGGAGYSPWQLLGPSNHLVVSPKGPLCPHLGECDL